MKWACAALAIAAISLILAHPASIAAQATSTPEDEASAPVVFEEPPRKPGKFDRVYDIAGRLDEEQFDRFHYDIGRMWIDGFPAVIYIRRSDASPEESQYFADRLRETWNIESAPGADDGLVLLVTIRLEFPHTAVLTLSYGENSFPSGQMTVEVLNQVLEDEANPRIRAGNINGGLTYALRRILYYTEYTAPFPPERTDAQETAHTLALPVSLIVLAALSAITFASRTRLPRLLRSRWALTITGIALAAVPLPIAIFGRATWATWVGVACVATLALLLWKLGRPETPTEPRTLRVHRATRRPRLHPRSRRSGGHA